MGDRLLTAKEVCEITGFSATTIYSWMNAGQFPSSVRMGPRAVRWWQSDVEAWLESRPHTREVATIG